MPPEAPVRPPRCRWCNGVEGPLERVASRPGEPETYVHPEHAAALAAWQARADRATPALTAAVAFLPLVVTVLAVIATGRGRGGGPASLGLVLAVLGAVLFRFPFPTPTTVALLGAAQASRLARVLGAALLVAGLAVCLATLSSGRARPAPPNRRGATGGGLSGPVHSLEPREIDSHGRRAGA